MKLRIALVATLLLLAACNDNREVDIEIESGPNPWSHLNFVNEPGDFSFAIVSDLTGGYREGVFPNAVRKLNLLQPEFVMSIGDLVEAYGFDAAEIEAQWQKFKGMIAPLDAPFFFVPGNHDMGNADMNAAWQRHVGRSWYHFTYHDTLFMVMNTEDERAAMAPEVMQLIGEYERLKSSDPEQAHVVGKKLMQLVDFENDMPGRFGSEQIAWMQQTLAQNTDVRHTFIFMHQPIWQGIGSPQMALLDEALGDRDYTIFAGHVHNYKHFSRNGRSLIRLGTTGGSWAKYPDDINSFDHVTLVTMTGDGPRIANLLLDGIVDRYGKQPEQ